MYDIVIIRNGFVDLIVHCSQCCKAMGLGRGRSAPVEGYLEIIEEPWQE